MTLPRVHRRDNGLVGAIIAELDDQLLIHWGIQDAQPVRSWVFVHEVEPDLPWKKFVDESVKPALKEEFERVAIHGNGNFQPNPEGLRTYNLASEQTGTQIIKCNQENWVAAICYFPVGHVGPHSWEV